MMSVFCSNSLILAPECGKCILRDPNFQNFKKKRSKCKTFDPYAQTATLTKEG